MKKHIPNFLTSCNVFTGGLGIAWVSILGNYELTIYFVLVAGIFDFLDGMAARALGVSSPIGKELDSLADMVSFGVLPALGVVQFLMDRSILSSFTGFSIIDLIPLLIIPFSALRLAKFNISTNQTKEFRGLPTPANAFMISSFLIYPDILKSLPVVIATTLISCFLLVSNIRMIALKFSRDDSSGNKLRYALILVIVAGFAVFQMSFLPFVIPAYIAISILGNYVFKTSVS